MTDDLTPPHWGTPEEYIPLAFDPTNPTHVEVIRRVIPDMRAIESMHNPLTQVRFRAGMLAMREIIAKKRESLLTPAEVEWFDENVIRQIWPENWLGPDPGTPRKNIFDEVTIANKWLTQEEADRMNQQAKDEGEEPPVYIAGEPCGWEMNPNYTSSLEALSNAHAFLVMIGAQK